MNLNTLKNFVSRLGFIFERSRNSSGYDIIKINEEKEEDGTQKIIGTVDMAIGVGESEVVEFTSTLTQSNERLKFESKYKVKNVKTNQGEKIVMAESEEFYSDDTFMILEYEEKKNSFDPIFNSKSKFLVHLEGQSISQVYLVGKKYQFENGISESFTLLSMSDANVVERVSQVCNNGVMRR